MPVGAYGGRKDIMSVVAPLGAVYQAGTLSGNPVAMAAGLAQLKLLKDEIKETIDSIEKPKERLVLSLRYVFMLTWEEIATAMMCSLRYVYILHKRALANVKIPGDSF